MLRLRPSYAQVPLSVSQTPLKTLRFSIPSRNFSAITVGPAGTSSTSSTSGSAISGASGQNSQDHEIAMLERLLEEARRRKLHLENVGQGGSQAKSAPNALERAFGIGTFNEISPLGLARFERSQSSKYRTFGMEGFLEKYPDFAKMGIKELDEVGPHAILLRSFKLGSDKVPKTVRAIARCGAGVNNIDVAAMSERGIPVFNTPGANANAVKELVICSLFLASRGIVPGIQHVKKLVEEEKKDFGAVKKRVEKEKKMFGGKELLGKRLGVVGLGHIGASVADTAIALGMDVVGYDPTIDIDAAWRLPGQVLQRANTLEELVSSVDYVTIHVPYMKETHHLIDKNLMKLMRPNAHLINFARGELVDTKSLKEMYDAKKMHGMYVADFADEYLYDHNQAIIMPHLGASTEEAESNSAQMAANQIMDFIETGSIRNSVNFPTVELPRTNSKQARLCIVNRNVPGMLGLITTTLGSMGLNIAQHINTSRDNLAYNAVDLEEMPETKVVLEVQKRISKLEGVISSRVIEPKPVPSFFMVGDQDLS